MPATVLCLRCQARSIFRNPIQTSNSPWPSQKRMASALRQRQRPPSRMSLAADVARSSVKRRDKDGPFGGMNRTEADIRKPVRKPPVTRDGGVGTARDSQGKTHSKSSKDDRPLFHALKMQTTLSTLPYSARTTLKTKLDKVEAFDQLGLRTDVLDAVASQALPYLETLVPSPAQKLAIPALISQKGAFEKKAKPNDYDQFLLAAETGSGKTLAYALPVIHHIKNQEDLDKAESAANQNRVDNKKAENVFEVEAPPLADVLNPDAATGRPSALILLPSSELVDQVGAVIKSISHKVKYRSAAISASNTPAVIRSRLFNPNGIDIVISTPHLVSSIAETEPNILSKVNHIVVDEADSLFDRSFREITLGIIDRAAPSLKQLVLCSATIPRSLDTFIDKRFPEMKRLVTPKLHSIPRRVQLGVLDIDHEPYRGNRMVACADAIWKLGRAEHDEFGMSHNAIKHILVFVNERAQAEEVATYLSSKGIDATALTRDTSERRRSDVLSSFTSPHRVDGSEKGSKPSRDYIPFDDAKDTAAAPTKPSRTLHNTKVLVTTDLGSRGIDTLAVRHAILYDVPHTTIDFVHRLGRLGRMNRRGRGIVLVGKKDRKDVVREVRDAMYRGQALI